ncbi:MAG: amidohydrolase family protein [Lentisphaerae bacterium]|nr:amidohydrolase family protein [Lentisphaerota bacterium]
MYDVKIVNGTMISGAEGEQPWPGCVAVKDRRIAALGRDISGPARQTLDAAGQAVCPGFIDIHTHCGIGPNLNYLQAGVTTVVTGNCGMSVKADELAGTVARVAGRSGPNIAHLIGHNTVRLEAMGNVARAPTSAELDDMTRQVATAMAAGAVGFSSGLTYMPGNYADAAEVGRLAKVAGEAGGFYATHMRDERDGVLDSIAETLNIAEAGGLPAHISHLKAAGFSVWGRSREVLDMLHAARARGRDVTWDQYPYTASSSHLQIILPGWLQEGTPDEIRARCLEPVTRARAKEELIAQLRRMFDGDGARIMFATSAEPGLSGRTLADLARSSGRSDSVADLAETVLDFVVRHPEPHTNSCVFHYMSEEDVRRILQDPVTIVASDGWGVDYGQGHPHPRHYGTCPRVLGHYARDEKVLPLAEAVRRMTAMPAARLGLADRGVLAEGAWADLVVFDPATIRDTATFEHPHQYPVGLSWVVVNGEVVVDHGQPTGRPAGVFVARETKRA